MSGGPFLYPSVTSLPGQSGVTQNDRSQGKDAPVKGEFDQALQDAIQTESPIAAGMPGGDLDHVRAPLKFSAHATQRLKDRKISLDAQTMEKVNHAIDKAHSKGVEDTLILTKDAALIVNVKNRTIVTAMDKHQLQGNVFTNIDGAVIVS